MMSMTADSAAMHHGVARTLSSRLLRITLLAALVLGLLISAIQIALDFKRVTRQPDHDMAALVSIILAPASAIVFSLDAARATELLQGVLSQPSVSGARIILENGTVFAEQQRPLASIEDRRINDFLLNRTRSYAWMLKAPLPIVVDNIGTLEIELDTHAYGQVFLERTVVTMAASLLFALMLTGLSLLIFYLLVTKPLTSVIRSIERVGDTPEKARLTEPDGHSSSEIGLLVRLTNQHFESIDSMLVQLRGAEAQLKIYSEGLEDTVSARTRELSESLAELEAAKDHLIQSEKMAALGGLVAGVAHEVNTPLGIAVTAASVLSETLAELKRQFEAKTLTSASFEKLVGHALDGNVMLVNNIDRAARLISDFKKTAVDQISEARCEFGVRSTLAALIASLHPETRRVQVEPKLICPDDLVMKSLPGVLTQVVSNLVVNSVRHAFGGSIAKPEITIVVSGDGDNVELEYRDNGLGVPAELHQKIFEPFYTSKRGQGGSGLGLNIVYNLVTRKLRGQLSFESAVGEGVCFRLRVPRVLIAEAPLEPPPTAGK